MSGMAKEEKRSVIIRSREGQTMRIYSPCLRSAPWPQPLSMVQRNDRAQIRNREIGECIVRKTDEIVISAR
jgi:hypothetical protein